MNSTITHSITKKFSQSALRVLIAEDDEGICEVLTQAIAELGYRVVAVTNNGGEAVAIASQHALDLVIMDIHLFGMDGLSAAEKILQQTSIPIVISTGMVDDDMLKRAQSIDVQSYLIKPFTLSQLKSAIRIAVAIHTRQSVRNYELELLREELPTFPVIEQAIQEIVTSYGDDRHHALQRLKGAASEHQITLTEAANNSLNSPVLPVSKPALA